MSEDTKQETSEAAGTVAPEVRIHPQALRSPQYRHVYANNLGFNLNNTDFTMVFAANASVPGIPMVFAQEEVAVTIPFVALKVMSEALPMILRELEKEMGPIRIPKASRPSQQSVEALLAPLRGANLVE